MTPEKPGRNSGDFVAAGSRFSNTPAGTVAGTWTAPPILPASCASPERENLKTAKTREVTVREANDFRYDPSDFNDFTEPDTSPPKAAAAIPLSNNGHFDLRSLRVSPRIKYLIQHGDSIGQYPSRSEALFAVIMALLGAGYDDIHIARLCLLEKHGISELPREKGRPWLAQELKRAHRKATSLTRQAQGEPEDSDDLMTDTIPSARPIVQGIAE